MPVAGATTRNDYVATSGQNVFNYTFQILLSSDLKVIQNGAVLSLNTDYTVAIIGQSGGFVTLSSPASAGDTVSVFLAMPIDRTTEYQNAGDFLASDVNGDFDKGYIAMNQLQTDIRRAVGLQDQDPTVNMELPLKADRASKFLAFNANGEPIVYTTPSGSGTASTYQPSFPGSVSRSLQDRLEDYTSVADFGAVGNGVTDDTAALQAAFSYGNTTRTKIVMEGKTYLYSGLLATITNSVEIEGAGDGTILLKDDSYTGPAFVIDNTFGQIPEFYPSNAGDQNLVANLTRVKSPSFSKFSIVGKSRTSAGFGFDLKDRNDMVSIQDVNCFNLKGSAFRFTGTFGNLRESNIRRLCVRMCGDENNPAVDLKMPSFSNTQATSSTVGGKTRFTLSGTGDNFSGLTGNRKIRVQGSRLDGGTKEWPVNSVISDTVVELPYDITATDPETGEPYGQAVTNAPTTFYRDVDGLNHIAFNDCQIVGCYGTYLRISHERVNFFRRVVFNNLMVHGSNKKYQDDAQQGPAGDLILIEGGIGSVDFRGLRINNNEVDKGVTPNILYAGMRVRAGQTITQDIPDRVWINDLDMLNLNNDGEAMFVIEKVKNMSVNGTVASSQNSGTELKVTADAVDVGLDYNVIPGTSKNIRNIGVLPAFSIDSTASDKVFITLNQRKETSISEDDYRELTSETNQNSRLGDTRFSRLYRANLVKNAPNVGATQAATEWTLADGRMAYIPARKAGATAVGTWTASSTSGEYYLAGSTIPTVTIGENEYPDVSQVIEDNYMILNEGTLGSLAYGEWKVGDNDSLGYNTLYVKPLAPVSPASMGETDLRYKQAADGSVVRVTRRTFYGGDLPNTGYYYNGDLFYDFTPSATTGDPVAWICRVRGYGNVGQIGGTATWEVFGVIDG
jgi:hypothetical protein